MRFLLGLTLGLSLGAAGSWAFDIYDPSGVQKQQERQLQQLERGNQEFDRLQQRDRQQLGRTPC